LKNTAKNLHNFCKLSVIITCKISKNSCLVCFQGFVKLRYFTFTKSFLTGVIKHAKAG